MNHLEKFGPRLIDQGYEIIPLVHKKKFPKEKGWQNIKATASDVPQWVKKGNTGVGVLCKNTPAVDLDIKNKELSIWMKDQVFEIAGHAPIRVGLAPKALLPFKTLKPFRKLSSKKFEETPELLHQVEILGEGNQFVAYGIHPDTEKPYKWNTGLAEILWDDLPTLGRIQAQEIIKVFEQKCRELGWPVHGEKKGEALNGGKQPLGRTLESRKPDGVRTPGGLSPQNSLENKTGTLFSKDSTEQIKKRIADTLTATEILERNDPENQPPFLPKSHPKPAPPTSVFPEVEGEAGIGSDAAAPYLSFEEMDRDQSADPGRLQIERYVVDRALADVNPEEMDYDEWLKVGMAIYHQLGDIEGKDVWFAWSSRSGKHNETEMDGKWDSFSPEPGRKPTTFRTVLRYAEKTRKSRDVMQEYLDRYVYIESNDTVHDLYGPPHKVSPILKNFRTRTAPDELEIEVSAPLKDDPGRTLPKKFPVCALWLKNGDRKWVSGEVYYPNNGEENRIREVGGYSYLNTFRMPAFPAPVIPLRSGIKGEITQYPIQDETGTVKIFNETQYQKIYIEQNLIAPFLNHMEYLFPAAVEREWFIDWMALNVQHPDRRCKVTPLHISLHHGTGRGWLVALLGKLLGHWNCTKAKMSEMVGSNGGPIWGNYLDNSLLCCVEEVHEGGNPYGVSEALRDILTEDTLQINVKYGGIETKRIFTNFFWMSNRADALILTDEDRRINVFRLDERPRDREYYVRLYGWSKGKGEGTDEEVPTAGVCALWHWLAARDLSEFNWQESLKSDSRKTLITGSENKVEMYFREIWNEIPGRVITIRGLKEIMGYKAEMEGEDPWQFGDTKVDRQLTKMLQQKGAVVGGLVKVNARSHRYWEKRGVTAKSMNLAKQTEILRKEILEMEKWILQFKK